MSNELAQTLALLERRTALLRRANALLARHEATIRAVDQHFRDGYPAQCPRVMRDHRMALDAQPAEATT